MALAMSKLPEDLIEAKDAAVEYRIRYTRLRSWWARGNIEKYVRGDGRVLVRRSDIERMLRVQRVDP